MKKLVALFLSVTMLFALFIVPVSALDVENPSVYVEYTQDGGYFIVEIEHPNISLFNVKSGSKSATYYDRENIRRFKVAVTGYFQITGSAYEAIDSSCDVVLYDSSCSVVSQESSYYGNSATATATVSCGSVNITKSVTISCDKNGNLY